MSEHDSILAEQMAYYRARAGEYDEWFLRQGRYDHGAAENARWFDEVDTVRVALDAFAPTGRVLELACGTGLWTQQLARHADAITAVDSSAEVIALNRERVGGVTYEPADLFSYEPSGPFDVVFFSFWLSHVPIERFDAFWAMVRRALAPEGRVFFVDSRSTPTSTARDHVIPETGEIMTRLLNDGRAYRIVKVFHDPASLTARLASVGWQADVRVTPSFFLYGNAV